VVLVCQSKCWVKLDSLQIQRTNAQEEIKEYRNNLEKLYEDRQEPEDFPIPFFGWK
jgi:hypothetical protein